MKLTISTEINIGAQFIDISQAPTKVDSQHSSQESSRDSNQSTNGLENAHGLSLSKLPMFFCEANLQLNEPPPSKQFDIPPSSFLLQEKSHQIKSQSISDKISSPNVVLKTLHNLYELCSKLFQGLKIMRNDLKALSASESSLLNAILKRKFMRGFTKAEIAGGPTAQLRALLLIEARARTKRPEECYKFVVSRVFKLLKTSFGAKSGSESERAFYLYYFGSLCFESKNSLPEFFIRTKGSETKTPTKVSVRYIQLIAQSPQLCRDLNFILANSFYSSCRMEMDWKLHSLLVKLEGWLQEGEEEISSQRRALTYLASDRFCKLPWSFNEIQRAVERFNVVWRCAVTKDEVPN